MLNEYLLLLSTTGLNRYNRIIRSELALNAKMVSATLQMLYRARVKTSSTEWISTMAGASNRRLTRNTNLELTTQLQASAVTWAFSAHPSSTTHNMGALSVREVRAELWSNHLNWIKCKRRVDTGSTLVFLRICFKNSRQELIHTWISRSIWATNKIVHNHLAATHPCLTNTTRHNPSRIQWALHSPKAIIK